MTYQNPKTRWKRHYSRRFRIKYVVTRQEEHKREISRRVIDIANHLMPNNIGGCVTCPGGTQRKIEFNTGLIIVYKFTEPDITFQSFRYVVN